MREVEENRISWRKMASHKPPPAGRGRAGPAGDIQVIGNGLNVRRLHMHNNDDERDFLNCVAE